MGDGDDAGSGDAGGGASGGGDIGWLEGFPDDEGGTGDEPSPSSAVRTDAVGDDVRHTRDERQSPVVPWSAEVLEAMATSHDVTSGPAAEDDDVAAPVTVPVADADADADA